MPRCFWSDIADEYWNKAQMNVTVLSLGRAIFVRNAQIITPVVVNLQNILCLSSWVLDKAIIQRGDFVTNT